MPHIILLGDSIFDNRAYTGREPDVVSHLREMLPSDDWQATLCAVDGALVENVGTQLQKVPSEATHLVISAGGNNALMNADVLQMRADSAAEVLSVLGNRAADFEFRYREMLGHALRRNLPTAVCTIYFPNFADAFIQKIATTALSVFNDAIIRQAARHRLPILDLRQICSEKDDYANEIEPSGKGGRKIAARILGLVQTHDFASPKSCVYI